MSTSHASTEGSADGMGRVVVGVHGSSSSLRALRHAVDIARDRGWDLELVTAWPDADETLIHDVPGRYIAARGRAVESQRQALATLDPPTASSVATFLVNARPAPALIARCGGADLLVVGAGRPEAERIGRRSVGAECVEAAPCPVTVVPDRLTQPGQKGPTRDRRRHQRRSRRNASMVGAAASA
jgi:nucleotide-binding universal stress UspA family protein